MEHPSASQAENIALFQYLVGDLSDWLHSLAPKGWEHSLYYFLHHPTPQMRYEEELEMHENYEDFLDDPSLPKLEDFEEEQIEELDATYELKDLLGRCLWCIFSNNHEVLNAKGVLHDIGSFRGSGRFIAEFLNQHYPAQKGFGYLDFYCADLLMPKRADLKPVYQLLFSKLKAANCDWYYSFPKIHLISFQQPKDTATDMTTYDPAKAMQQELEDQEKRKATAEFQRKLEEDYEERKEAGKYQAPPVVVQAYQTIYGNLPKGYLGEK